MVQPDGSVLTRRTLSIFIPERFVEKDLAKIESETYILGIFAIVVDGTHYGVSTTNAMMRVTPTSIRSVKFEGASYLEMMFEPGSVVFPTTLLVKTDTLVYRIFDEFIAKGHIPWYVDYDDLARLFETADEHAGVKLGPSHSIMEMFAAAIARDPKDKTKYFRQTATSLADTKQNPPALIPFRSVIYGATNTTAKVLGSYFGDGLTSALAEPSTKPAPIETLLRT